MNSNAIEKKQKSFLSKKNIIFISIFLIILVIISVCVSVFFLGIRFDTINSLLSQEFSINNLLWLFLMIISLFYIILWNSFYLLRYAKDYGIKAKWYEWFIYGIVSIFFNSVTPFSLGSEPYRLYWLNKHGLNANKSLLVISITTIFWSATQIVITWPSFIYISTKYHILSSSQDGLIAYWFTFGGMLVDLLIFSTIFLLSYSKNCHVFLYSIYNFVLKKLKKPYKTKQQIIEEYKTNEAFKKQYIQEIKKIKNIVWQSVGTVLYSLTYYFSVYYSFRLINIDVFTFGNVFNIANVAWTANNFIPIPGGEGTIQIILQKFLIAFQPSSIVDENQINSAIFVWRSFTFYIPTVMGLILFPYVCYDFFKKRKTKKLD